MKLHLLSQETGIIIIRAGMSLKTQPGPEACCVHINILIFTTTSGGRYTTIVPILQIRKQRFEREASLRNTHRIRTLQPKDSPDIQESEDSENLIHGNRIQSRGVERTGVQSWEEDLGALCDPVFVFITPSWVGFPVTPMVHAVSPT